MGRVSKRAKNNIKDETLAITAFSQAVKALKRLEPPYRAQF
jgi:hypothetical protein